jgi:hypothetical protein
LDIFEGKMDWFERLTGFREISYADTKRKLAVEGNYLRSLVNGKRYRIGELELVSVQTLRERVQDIGPASGQLKVDAVTGDVQLMHQLSENAGAMFQVASQFNLLEMISPRMTPENVLVVTKTTQLRGRHAQSRRERPRSIATILRQSVAASACCQRNGPTAYPPADYFCNKIRHERTSAVVPKNIPESLTLRMLYPAFSHERQEDIGPFG